MPRVEEPIQTHYPKKVLVFDVESVGLHGEGFAVGWVVLDVVREEVRDGWIWSCFPGLAKGSLEDLEWVCDNIPPLPENRATPREVRNSFWAVWREAGAVLAADSPWPVEARFLAACIDDAPDERKDEGPYPLIDVASAICAVGWDPVGPRPWDPLASEGEARHSPLDDARRSANALLHVFLQGGMARDPETVKRRAFENVYRV